MGHCILIPLRYFRCPPTAPAPGQNCYTLPDISDPCCNITVCDDPVLDPKENVDKEQKQPRILGRRDQCLYKNKIYEIGQDFHDGCSSFCFCSESGEAICNPIQCPSNFGLDVINPFCLEWENTESFVAEPPLCCPPVPKCKSDGACDYKGVKFNNYDNIPANMTGCEQRCYCENGEVLCQEACYELPKEPPGYIACSASVAIKVRYRKSKQFPFFRIQFDVIIIFYRFLIQIVLVVKPGVVRLYLSILK